MATTITEHWKPTPITLGNIDVATKVTLPAQTRRVWLYCETNAGKAAYSGTDGGAVSANYLPIGANQIIELEHPGDAPIYLASATAGTVVRVTAIER